MIGLVLLSDAPGMVPNLRNLPVSTIVIGHLVRLIRPRNSLVAVDEGMILRKAERVSGSEFRDVTNAAPHNSQIPERATLSFRRGGYRKRAILDRPGNGDITPATTKSASDTGYYSMPS
jgi:hypothetical protein